MKASALSNLPSPGKRIALPLLRTYTSARSIAIPFRYADLILSKRSFGYEITNTIRLKAGLQAIF
jgi:hypothetical protein